MRAALVVVLVLCLVSLSLARRHHKKHHRKHWPHPQPYYEPDVFYDPPISSENPQSDYPADYGLKNSEPVDDGRDTVEQQVPVEDESMPADEVPVEDIEYAEIEQPVDEGFNNPDGGQPDLVDERWPNPAAAEQEVPVDEAWGKEEEVDGNAWVEEREEPVEDADSLEVDWREAQQERKPWFEDQVEIRHDKMSSLPQDQYDDGFEDEPVEDIDGIDLVDADGFNEADDEASDFVNEEDLWEYPEVEDGRMDTSEELYGDESDYSTETSEEYMDTSEEMYGDSESQAYSSETSEEQYGGRDGHDDWENREDDNNAGEDEQVDDWLNPKPTPADIGELPLTDDWRSFTPLQYGLFAAGGAVFFVLVLIIMVLAIRAATYRKPIYRRLETPVAV